MFVHTILPAILALATGSLALPTTSSTSVFESIDTAPSGWAKADVDYNKDDVSLNLRIQLIQQNMDKFHELATNIATPGHELYGNHLSQDAIDSMIAPKDESKDAVLQWLGDNGLADAASVSPRGNFITVEATVSQVEKLLGTEYNAYSNEESGATILRTLEYSLPESLNGHVKMVQPTTFFGLRSMGKASGPLPETDGNVDAVTGCTGSIITPTCLSNLYNFASSGATQTTGRMGIAGFLAQHPSKTDLTTFMKKYAVFDNAAETYTCTLINEGTCPATGIPGTEANLDVQYARAITKDIPNVFYSTGGSPPIVGTGTNENEPYLQFADYLLALDDTELPNTISISYGDDESTVPLSYADEVCNLFSQLGARGVSVLVASGDSGVGTTCKLNGKTSFTTSFPAACPWVTVVGGTTKNTPESAWADGGGGFSEVFGQPSYQTSAVSTWLTTNTDGMSAYFNKSGRAYPDVAAQATYFEIVVEGFTSLVDGTSCASPTFSSVIQLLNSERLAAGKSALGFLNPWLYSNASTALTDITSGGNTGCTGVIKGAGFSAIKGWDPATGLGTPNYELLLTASNAI
ncbi:peptidase S8/S53 domain-containing protein [Xylariales sp. PMI_506]|nr:peptidase S8/S53 domain-containing protein [Xylariales sp. PMI_506]